MRKTQDTLAAITNTTMVPPPGVTNSPKAREVKKTRWIHFQDIAFRAEDILGIYVLPDNAWGVRQNAAPNQDGPTNKIMLEVKRNTFFTVQKNLTLQDARAMLRDLLNTFAPGETNEIIYAEDPPTGEGWK